MFLPCSSQRVEKHLEEEGEFRVRELVDRRPLWKILMSYPVDYALSFMDGEDGEEQDYSFESLAGKVRNQKDIPERDLRLR
jgi:hypothetical protein